MEIRIQSIHFDADKKLLAFTEKKVGKLSVVFDRIVDADVYLRFDNGSTAVKEKAAEIKINIPGTTLFAKEHSKTFEKAIDNAVGSLRKQLKKYKEKLKN